MQLSKWRIINISEISEIILMLRSVENLQDDCTGSGSRAVLEAPQPPQAPREFSEAGFAAGRGAGDVVGGGALARRLGSALPLKKRRVEVSHVDWSLLKQWGLS
jgi:hypothetical protein